jgi:hypothetical protein
MCIFSLFKCFIAAGSELPNNFQSTFLYLLCMLDFFQLSMQGIAPLQLAGCWRKGPDAECGCVGTDSGQVS